MRCVNMYYIVSCDMVLPAVNVKPILEKMVLQNPITCQFIKQ